MNKVIPLAIVAIILFIAFNTMFSTGRLGYDAGRNEKVVSELLYYKTFTYFDVPFVVSPPLFFIIHMTVAGIFGLAPWVFQFTEALLYAIGALIVFPLSKELGISRKWAGVSFLALLLDNQMFAQLQSIDFWGGILLFSALMLFSYLRFLRSPSIINMIVFGICTGLAMLFKSSFAFLIAPLVIHYIIFSIRKGVGHAPLIAVPLIIAGILYLPWVYYLTSNGFPIVTNPEFYGKLPWDPNFTGYSYIDVYKDAISNWVLLYPLSLFAGIFLIRERIRTITFEQGLKVQKKLTYIAYKYYLSGAGFIAILFIVISLPFFNRSLVAIPVGEQFLTVAFCSYLLIGIALSKIQHVRVRYAILALLVVNIVWSIASLSPIAAADEYIQTCPLYSTFFSSLNQDKMVLVDERLSPIPYPVHSVLYKPAFEWFSYQEQYDIARIITMNVDYLALIESEKIPAYTQGFQRLESFFCVDPRTDRTFNATVFLIQNRDVFAESLGLPFHRVLVVKSNGQPLQAAVTLTQGDFAIEFKTKRDGSLTVYAPSAGNYTVSVSRPGFKTSQTVFTFPGTGDSFINLEKDSPLITHTTASRY